MLTAVRYLPSALRHLVVDGADVPRDLASVTTIASDEERDPQRVGMTREGVDAIWRSVENMYATGMHPGISLVVRRHGQVVLKRAIGHAKGNGPGDVDEKPVPMTPDTPVCIFSASKAMAAMTVHLLSERKQLSLLDPVSHYIPEFGAERQARHHDLPVALPQGGDPDDPDQAASTLPSCCSTTRRSCGSSTARLRSKPGHHHAYHALTAGFVIADLVERVSRRRLPRLLPRQHQRAARAYDARFRRTRRRTDPRGAQLRRPASGSAHRRDMYLKRAIGTTLEHAVKLSNDPRYYRAVIPAGNGVGTADECSQFFQCLLNGGKLGGVRVCSSRSPCGARSPRSAGRNSTGR